MPAFRAYSRQMEIVFLEDQQLVNAARDGTQGRLPHVGRYVSRSRDDVAKGFKLRRDAIHILRVIFSWRMASQRRSVMLETGFRRRHFSLIQSFFCFWHDYVKNTVDMRRKLVNLDRKFQMSLQLSAFSVWRVLLPKNALYECDWDCGFCGTQKEVQQHEAECPAMMAGTAWKKETTISTRSVDMDRGKQPLSIDVVRTNSLTRKLDSPGTDVFTRAFSETSSKVQAYLQRLIESKTVRSKLLRWRQLLTIAFEGWRMLVNLRAARCNSILKQAQCMTKRDAIAAFRVWKSAYVRGMATRNAATNRFHGRQNRVVASAFQRYVLYVRSVVDIRSKVTCEMYGSKMNQVCHTFDSWALAVVESQKIRSRLAEGGGGLPGRISFRYDALENLRMLGMWRENVARTKAIRVVLARAFLRRHRRALNFFWQHWVSLVTKERCQRRRFVKLTSWLLNALFSRSIQLWQSNVRFVRSRRQFLQNSIRCCEQKSLLRVLRVWIEYRRCAKKVRFTTAKAIKRRNVQALKFNFWIWVNAVWEYVFMRGKLRSCLFRLRRQVLCDVMGSWVENCVARKSLKSKEYACAKFWQSSTLLTHFERWMNRRHQKSHIRQMILRSIFRYDDDCKRRSFKAWSYAQRESTRHRLNKLSLGLAGLPFAMSLSFDLDFDAVFVSSNKKKAFEEHLLNNIGEALDIESERVSILCHHRGFITGIERVSIESQIALTNLPCYQAFDSEQLAMKLKTQSDRPASPLKRTFLGQHVVGARLQGPICQLALDELLKAKTFEDDKAFYSLFECDYRFLQPMLAVGQEAHQVLEEATQKLENEFLKFQDMRRTKMKRIISIRKLKSLRAALLGWLMNMQSIREARVQSARCLQQWRSSYVRLVWDGWANALSMASDLRTIGQKALTRWSRSCLGCAFDRWQETVFVLGERRRLKLQKAAGRCFGKRDMSAFSRWSKFVSSKLLRDENAHTVAVSWVKLQLKTAWCSWSVHARTSRRQRIVVMRVALRMRNVTLFNRFTLWKANFLEKRRQRGVLQRMASVMRHHATYKAYMTWGTNVYNIRRQRGKLTTVTQRMRNAAASRAFFSWLDRLQQQQRLRLAAHRVIKRWIHSAMAAAWTNWQEAVEKTVRKYAGNLMIHKWLCKQISYAFMTWKSVTAIGANMRRVKKRIILRMLSQTLATSFVTWHQESCKLSRQRSLLKRIVLRMENVRLAKAFTLFHATCKEIHRQRKLCTRIVLRIENRLLSLVLLTWYANASDLVKTSNTLKRILQTWLQRNIAGALKTWVDSVSEKKRMQNAARKICARWQNHAIAVSFGQWCENVSEHVNLKRAARKVVIRWRNQNVSMVLNGWQGRVAAKRRLHSAMEKVHARWKFRTKKVSFATWHANMLEIKRHRFVLEKITAKMLNLSVSKAFSQWDIISSERCELRSLMIKALQRMHRRLLAQALATWVSSKSRISNERFINRMLLGNGTCSPQMCFVAWRKWILVIDAIRSVGLFTLRVYGKVVLARVLDAWAEMAARSRFYRKKGLKLRIGWSARKVALMLQAWRQQKEFRQDLRLSAKKIMGWWRLKDLLFVWNSWVSCFVEQRRLRRSAASVIQRWCDTTLSRSFDFWNQRMHQDRKHRSLMKRCCMKMLMACLAKHFDSWSCSVDEIHRLRNVMKRVALRMCAACVSKCWRTWAENAAEKRYQRAVLKHTVLRIKNSFLSAAFGCWFRNVNEESTERQEEQRRQYVMARAVARMRNAMMSCVLGRWRSQATLFLHVRDVLARVTYRMRHRCIAAALDTWTINVEEARAQKTEADRQQRVLTGIVKRMTNGALGAAYALWASNVAEISRNRIVMRKIVLRLSHRTMSLSFDLWCQAVETLKVEQANVERRRQMSSKVIQRMLHGALTASFHRWYENVQELQTMAVKTNKVVVRWRNRTLAAAHALWASIVADVAQNRAIMSRIVRRMSRLLMFGAFQRWQENVRDIARLARVSSRVVDRWHLLSVATPFSTWCDRVVKHKRLKRAGSMVVARWQQATLSSAFETWSILIETIAEEMRALASFNKSSQAVKRIWRHICQRCKSICFHHWFEMCVQNKHLGRCVHNIRALIRLRGLQQHFVSWFEHWRHGCNLRARLGRAVRSLRHLPFINLLGPQRMRLILQVWRDSVVAQQHKTVFALHIISEWRKVQLTRIFTALLDHVTWSKQDRLKERNGGMDHGQHVLLTTDEL